MSPLDRARRKAYWRLLPLCFICYVIAYVDRANVAIAKLTMTKDLAGFDNAVIGFGAGVFFIGYFLLEIPGTLIIERWSARKWLARIMVTWGVMAALTAAVEVPWHFYIGPVPPRPGGSGLLSRRHRLSDTLVPRQRSRASARLLPDRHADRANRQPQDLKRAARHRDRRNAAVGTGHPSSRSVGPGRMAVGVHRLGHSRGCSRRDRLLRADRLPSSGDSGSARKNARRCRRRSTASSIASPRSA